MGVKGELLKEEAGESRVGGWGIGGNVVLERRERVSSVL